MLKYGNKWGKSLKAKGILNETYYDAERVFFQIADYTGKKEPWTTYALQAQRVYRDNYAIANDYQLPGYWRFPHGIYMGYVRTGDPVSAQAIILMRDKPAFSDPVTNRWNSSWYYQDRSREVAYAINANIIAERVGQPRNVAEMVKYLDMALNHVQEWTTNQYGEPNSQLHYIMPFMTGLTMEALTSYYDWEVEQGHNPDETIPKAVKSIADYLWTTKIVSGPDAGKRLWVDNIGGTSGAWNDKGGTGYGGFRYVDRIGTDTGDSTQPAPDLNLLVAPAYAWLYKHYSDVTYRDRGDLIWTGGVALADVAWSGKLFNQNYRWSFDYVKWREFNK